MEIRAYDRTIAVTAALALVADQASKAVARVVLPLCSSSNCSETDVIGTSGFTRVNNGGSAFGFLPGLDLWIILGLAGIVAVPLLARIAGNAPAAAWSAGLLIGGGLGNFSDRLAFGVVTDFIDLGNKLVVNVADLALVAGCVLLSRSLHTALSGCTAPTPEGR